MVRRADAARWRGLLDGHGYTADTQFNTLHGAQRLLHYDPAHQRQLDTFVSSFAMCHALDLEDRLPAGSATLAPADLLLTKLQIYEVNDKDLIDAIALLLSHPVGADGQPEPRHQAAGQGDQHRLGLVHHAHRQPGQSGRAAAGRRPQRGRRPPWWLGGSTRSARRWPVRRSR